VSEDLRPDWRAGVIGFPAWVEPPTPCSRVSNSSMERTRHGVVKLVQGTTK
jgi:hypothetical protein